MFRMRLPRKSILLWGAGSLVIAALVWLARDLTYKSIHRSERSAFERSCSILSKEIKSYIYGLQGMAGIVHTHNYEPSLSQIRHYAQNRDYFQNFGGALGFGFIRFVPRGDLSAYLKNIRKQKPNFEVKTLSNYSGDHFIIEAIEPEELNGVAQGLDVATELNRRATALKARRLREPTLTAPLKLLQAKSRGMGFLFFHPIFDQTPSKVKFVGWSYAPILMDQLLDSLKLNADERLEFKMTDVTERSRPLEIFSADGVKRNKIKLEYVAVLKIAGRVWEIRGGVPDQSYHGIIDSLSVTLLIGLIMILGGVTFLVEEQVKKNSATKQRLGEMESWQKAVLDSADYSIISSDINGIIQTFNNGAQKLLGYNAEEVVGKHTPAIFHNVNEVTSRAVQLSKELGRSIEPGFGVFVEKASLLNTPDTNEWSYIRKNGTTVPVSLSVTAIRTQDQQIVGYLGIAEDISHLKKLQSLVEIQQTNLVSTAKMTALGEMAGGMAHEINNPLAILHSRITFLMMRIKLPQPDLQWVTPELEKLQVTIERIAKIIQGLRSFSREGKDDHRTPVKANHVIEETLDLCRQRFSTHGIGLSVTGDADAVLVCRSVQISQVLMNLLNNSFDAIMSLDEKWINIDVRTTQKMTQISVTDSGHGIDAETVKKMMEPFFTTKEVGKGTGLGLSISSGIMSAHNGKLKYNNLSLNTQFIMEFHHA